MKPRPCLFEEVDRKEITRRSHGVITAKSYGIHETTVGRFMANHPEGRRSLKKLFKPWPILQKSNKSTRDIQLSHRIR